MAELIIKEPLLTNGLSEHGKPKSMPWPLCITKWALKSLMWAIFLIWVLLIVTNACDAFRWIFQDMFKATIGTMFGFTGSLFVVFTLPILLITALAYVYMIIFSRTNFENKAPKFARFKLWTFPMLVDGPFGVVSAAELIGIILFASYILWAVWLSVVQTENLISRFTLPLDLKGYLTLDLVGLQLGIIGMFCLSFLFLPVARGSILLRLIDIPFEHATRYHVWLGHLTMMLFTLHGLSFTISWTMEGRLSELWAWKSHGISNFPGVVSLIAGILIWITSLHQVRKRFFELFFYTHQLYVVFIVFLLMHVGEFSFCFAAGGIFLFILDRFLRFCQSRTKVDVISASCLPCGTVELVLSKPPNLQYNALSFIFIQARELSFLQWHPFSVSSSPLDGKHHIAVLIKVLGEWTDKLRDIVRVTEKEQKNSLQTARITASVEGPYGHESAYHLMYENLILVAGGIGISPFLAILSDVFHRIEDNEPCLPRNILVIWSVKKSKELSLISTIDSQSVAPSLPDKLNLDIKAYVTQESEPSLEEGNPSKITNYSPIPENGRKPMSSLVGTGNNVLAGIYFMVSLIGFIFLYGLVMHFYIQPYNATIWFRGLLFIMCMVASVVVFGGSVVFLWNHLERRSMSSEEIIPTELKDPLVSVEEPVLQSETTMMNLMNLMDTQYGRRPDFQEIFNSFAQRTTNANVGVLVCGPPGLQTSVAKECRSQSFKGRWNQPVFHFHSHSFDL